MAWKLVGSKRLLPGTLTLLRVSFQPRVSRSTTVPQSRPLLHRKPQPPTTILTRERPSAAAKMSPIWGAGG